MGLMDLWDFISAWCWNGFTVFILNIESSLQVWRIIVSKKTNPVNLVNPINPDSNFESGFMGLMDLWDLIF